MLHERSRWGIAPELTLTCSACERETSEVMSNRIGRYFEVNRRAVFARRAVGLGREGLVKFCALMDMPPPMSNTSYQAHQDALLVAAGDVAQHSLTSATATVREQAETEGSSARGDVAVTFDGTWMKRGHTSLYGAWNGMLWGICPKTKFAGADVVKLCAALTCLRFNNGLVSYLSVLEAMGMERGVFATSILAEQDRRRISAADRKATDRSKKARKRRRVRKGLEDDIWAAEGVIYGPGIAN